MSVLALPRLRLPSTLMLGAILLAIIVIAAIVGIWVTPYDPTLFAVRLRLQSPSLLHPFGTDEFGRDVLSRILAGAHLSLATGFGAMAISLVVGVPLGLIAAFHRGVVQEVIMRAVDLLIALPPVLLGLLVLAVTPPGLFKTIAAVGLVYVPILVRLTRAVALGLLEEDFVQAARARGEGAFPILWHEILPNAWPPIIVECGLRVTFAILLGSALSFLGLGFSSDVPSWGSTLRDAKDYLDIAPHWALFPGAAIFLTVLTINFIGDGLRDALDPRRVL